MGGVTNSFLSDFLSVSAAAAFDFLSFDCGTLGVFTGSIGLPVRDRLPKKRMGFSGLILVAAEAGEAAATVAAAAADGEDGLS